jgi:L-threonylcarbamoyladenylate synthase
MDPQLIAQAVALLRAGRLVAFPTETVYGLGANALDPAAVERIFTAKGRPPTSPLIVHVAGVAMARSLALVWPETAEKLAEHFWPGPLTLVVPKRPVICGRITAGLPTVGLRMPRHPVALALLREAGFPIAAPSANPFTRLSPTTAAHVRESLGSSVALVLDGGPCEVGIESTVVSLAGPQPVLLRPGMVSSEQIEAVIGPVLLAADAPLGAAHEAPGQHARHYSPRTPLLLATRDAVPTQGRGVFLYWSGPPATCASILLPSNPSDCAAVLYSTLHDLDRQNWDWIAVEPPPAAPEWRAIRDRLRRAAARGSAFTS